MTNYTDFCRTSLYMHKCTAKPDLEYIGQCNYEVRHPLCLLFGIVQVLISDLIVKITVLIRRMDLSETRNSTDWYTTSQTYFHWHLVY